MEQVQIRITSSSSFSGPAVAADPPCVRDVFMREFHQNHCVVSCWFVNVAGSCDDDPHRHSRLGVLARLCAAFLDEHVEAHTHTHTHTHVDFTQAASRWTSERQHRWTLKGQAATSSGHSGVAQCSTEDEVDYRSRDTCQEDKRRRCMVCSRSGSYPRPERNSRPESCRPVLQQVVQ